MVLDLGQNEKLRCPDCGYARDLVKETEMVAHYFCTFCSSNFYENKVTVSSANTEACGKKYDKDKLRMDLIPGEVLEALAEVLTYGAKKYEANNWQKVETWRYEAAALRHWAKYKKGEKCDSESGLPHLWHFLCNAAFLVWKEIHLDKK